MINNIVYDNDMSKIYLINDGKKTLLIDDISSKPIESPNGKYIAFINPFGWECMSNVYIMNLFNNHIYKVYSWEYALSPKYINWESNKSLLVILGKTYGAIEIGGNLHRINIENKSLDIVKEFDKNIQITEFSLDGDIITVSGIKYIDDLRFSHISYKESFRY